MKKRGKEMETKVINPVTRLDYPDIDVIRVGDTYYMVSTTMHFMPGCEILRSYDLARWEHAAYVYDRLDSTAGQTLTGEGNIYGKGMWAASLRFHRGVFYVCFVANDTRKTYLFMSESIEGPWEKRSIEGFYHDCSLLFDDDGRVYIAYGNRDIYITELKADLSGPLEGGLHRLAVRDTAQTCLGYEGTHFYKIRGKYYLFFIHSLEGRWMRAEACFMADSLEGEFTGGDVLVDDMGLLGQGVAQGGIVDTPEGKWYGMLFQDSGAVGRIPVLVPVTWSGDRPVFGEGGKAPRTFMVTAERPEHDYEPLVQGDDFGKGRFGEEEPDAVRRRRLYGCFGLKSSWQFNHEPDLSLLRLDQRRGVLWMQTDKLCRSLTQTRNMLTQRMRYPACAGEVTVDFSGLKEGDYAGICALQGCYGMVAVTRRGGAYFAVMRNLRLEEAEALRADLAEKETGKTQSRQSGMEGEEREAARITGSQVRLRVEAVFGPGKDHARFYYQAGGEWKRIGETHRLYFRLDHFTGCRFGLFLYATEEKGGRAGFSDFVYRDEAGEA